MATSDPGCWIFQHYSGLTAEVGLAEALRASRPGLRVLYMSGYTAEYPLLDEVRKSGAVFLQKPLTLDSLHAKVREALA